MARRNALRLIAACALIITIAYFSIANIVTTSNNESLSLEELFKKAEKGDAQAQYQIGSSHHFGYRAQKDLALALSWYEKAARQGLPRAQYMAGILLGTNQIKTRLGLSDEDADKRALEWFQKSAEQEFSGAQERLGLYYSLGWGVKEDPSLAVKWYEKAAKQGNWEAQDSLAHHYYEGLGVPQYFKKAAYWYLKAAEQDSYDAQYSLGRLYQDGKGVPQDFAEAYFWINLAASKFPPYARVRDDIAKGLPQDVLISLQKRASKWKPKKQ